MPFQPDLEVFVYDRWGQLVFHTKNYGIDEFNVWEGKSQKNGNDMPIGTYYYIIQAHSIDQEPITGTVTIVR